MLDNYRGILCVIGGFLVHFTLGTSYTFGNLSPYISSYMKFVAKLDVSNGDMVWITAFSGSFQGISMTLGGIMLRKLGAKMTVLIGSWIMSASVMLTYFTIQINIYVIILTYGVLFGIGTGIAYSVAIAAVIKWYSENNGFIIGIVVAGFGLGSLVFNQVQTLFINPHNLSPNITIGKDKYFNDLEMLDRVPYCFLLTGGIYAIIQTFASLLLFTPTVTEIKELSYDAATTDSNYLYKNNEFNSSTTSLIRQKPYHVLYVLKTRNFWVLWLSFGLIGTGNVLITSLYKTFGQLFITSDYYLAAVGSVAAIFNSGSRIFWGRFMDKFSYKFAIISMTTISTIFMATFYCCKLIANENAARIMLIIWISVIIGNICGAYALMPAVIAKLFGTEHVATIYGMIFTANAVAGTVGALISSSLLIYIGYLWIFEISAIMLFCASMVSFFFFNERICKRLAGQSTT